MIEITSKGSFAKTDAFLQKLSRGDIFASLNKYGAEGVAALASVTPTESGLTAASWTYEVSRSGRSYEIVWRNTNSAAGKPVAILLQYGHGTGTGGYVSGRDYINPVMQPLFDRIANDVWKAVTSG